MRYLNLLFLTLFLSLIISCSASSPIMEPDPSELSESAPSRFTVMFKTSKGDFLVEVERENSPLAVDRFYYLVKHNYCQSGAKIASLDGSREALLTGERVALNLAMRLSGIATATRSYAEEIADLPTRLVDTRKTTPGLRVLEK